MIDPLDLIEQRLVDRVAKVKRRGDKIDACCPAHEDKNPSLGVGRGTRGRDIVIKCQAGCTADAVLTALDLKWSDLGDGTSSNEPEAEYEYVDSSGRLLYVVVRFPGKQFRQKRPDGTGWAWNLKGVERTLYHLDEVVAAVADGKTIYLVEGERDADTLRSRGVVATCNSGGAGKFTWSMAEILRGATVVVIVDRDRPGYAHAVEVRNLLAARGCSVTVKEPSVGKDITDHLLAGLSSKDLVTINPAQRLAELEEQDARWPDPAPIGGGLDALPTFPVEVFPSWIADHVRQVARELQVPVDLPANLAVVALAACAAKRAEVWMTRSWREQLCMYVVVGMPPGAGKSPAFSQILGPLVELEASMIAEALPRIEEQQTRRAIVEKLYRKAIDKGEATEALMYGDELRNTRIDAEPRLFVDDVTVEKLGEMLRDQGGRLALTSTEGGLFDQMVGRYSEKTKASLDPYLQMWSGDTVRVDRIGRGSVVIDKPALTIGVTVQPSVIEALRDRPELKGRGLTARFMYAIPRSNVGFRNMTAEAELDDRVADAYADALQGLWRHLAGSGLPVRIEVTPQAKAQYNQWRQMLEQERRPGGEMVALTEWSTKLESSVIRLAGLLHLAHGKGASPIDASDITAALTVGEYWITHAQAIHAMWGADPVTTAAQTILKWIAAAGLVEFSIRDCYNAHRQMLPRAEEALEPLELLVERGWLRIPDDQPLSVGKRGVPSPRLTVHPELSSYFRNNHAVMRTMRLETQKSSSSSSTHEDQNAPAPTHDTHDTHGPHEAENDSDHSAWQEPTGDAGYADAWTPDRPDYF